MFRSKKGQISTEYIILIAFLLTIIIPLGLYSLQMYQEQKDGLSLKQAERAGFLIINEAESIFYQGPPSMSNLKVYFPPNVFDIQIDGRYMNIRLKTKDGIQDVLIPSKVNVTGSIEEYQGMHYINIKTTGEYVEITE